MPETKIEGLKNPTQEWIDGAVAFKEWHRLPWSTRLAIGVTGKILIVSGEDVFGFKVEGGGHANWGALVRGPSGVIHGVPGCQVESITYDCEIESGEFLAIP